MKRILYVSGIDMDTSSGGGLATLAYYNALCDIYPGLVDCAIPEEFCKDKFKSFLPIPRRTKWNMLSKWSIHRIKSFMEPFLKKEASKYSLCVINGGVYAGDMMNMIHSYGLKIVVIHHNYETEYHMTNKSLFTFKGKFPYLISYNEKRAYKKSDLNLFLTEPDMLTFGRVYGKCRAQCHLIGCFETESRLYTPSKCESNSTIVITGSLCTYQTIYSLLNFEKKYFEEMKKHFPNYKLLIAGRMPGNEIMELESRHPEDIKIIANPTNMDNITDKGSIYLCTTCVGGGLKLRVMDGLKRGMAVLVHKVSARGYEQFLSFPYFQVYDDVDSFVLGLSIIKKAIEESNNNFQKEIINQYNQIFGYEKGVARMRSFFQIFD